VNNNGNQFLYLNTLNWGTTNNNGTLQSVTEQVAASGTPSAQSGLTSFTQTYGYDTANRLQTASDTGGWSRSFAYDQTGNMWITGASGIGLSPAAATSNVYSPTTNQKSNERYDAAGNQTTLGGNYSFSYDAENRQIQETNTLGNPAAQYAYDGNGNRVEKMVGGTTTIFVYDALGQLTAEYSNLPASTLPCQTCYLVQDHLGSTRLVTDQNAKAVSFHDYLPFGEEVPGNSVGRGTSLVPALI
jgi:YD repeat-containing protein